jgi:sporulation protein YlmC with PRC-barrel domain
MKDVPLHAPVECTDGPVGQSTTIIIDPQTLRVTHYAVKQSEKPHTEYLVPVEKIAETTSTLIRLNCTKAELSQLAEFVVKEYRQVEIPRYSGAETGQVGGVPMPPDVVTVAQDVEHVPFGERAVHKGAHVNATDGKVGEVEELLLNESGQISHLVLREGHWWGGKKRIVLPLSAVDKVVADTVYLKLDKATVSSLLVIPDKSGGK